MVREIPSFEEFQGIIDNVLVDNDFYADEEDDEKQLILAAVLLVLRDFYYELRYYSTSDILSNNFDKECLNFTNKLSSELDTRFNDYIESKSLENDMLWALPTGIVPISITIDNIVKSNSNAVVEQLKNDLKVKASHISSYGREQDFVVYSNFRRAIKRLTEVVKNNTDLLKSKVQREYMNYVYGENALFQWVCSGVNTCAWCYEIDALGPQPLKDFPMDHPNGACSLVPVEGTKYTKEYLKNRRYEI